MARPAETSQTLSRGLDVLRVVATSPVPLTPAQIATRLDLSRTIVYRLVGTLVEHGLVRRTESGALAIGLAALSLSQNLQPQLRDATRVTLDRLAEETGATAHLAVADGQESVAIAVVEPKSTTFHVAYRVGARHPIERGALGRALLAAREGRSEVHESAGELIPGAKGIVASVTGLLGIPAAVGVVTLRGAETPQMRVLVERAAKEITQALR